MAQSKIPLRDGVAECGFRHSCARRNPVKPTLDSRVHGNCK